MVPSAPAPGVSSTLSHNPHLRLLGTWAGTYPPVSGLIFQREAYDPNFLGHKATNDLFVVYPYKDLGCPRLVYFNTPWKPVLEL